MRGSVALNQQSNNSLTSSVALRKYTAGREPWNTYDSLPVHLVAEVYSTLMAITRGGRSVTLKDRIATSGPKRLLALDGGGIRGMMTVRILARIEEILRKRQNEPLLVLADYFDYIAGTSTGGIIATCLALGWDVSRIEAFYKNRGKEMFDKSSFLKRFRYKYEDEQLSRLLQEEFKEAPTLGSDKLKTLLMLVMRNATTDSPWPISNNPKALFNDPTSPECNLNLPLWQLVRASTAAPVYFPPEMVRVGAQDFVFVDGGITTYNNPAFQLFLMATTEPYRLNWPTGTDKMLLVSIGTGTNPDANKDLNPGDMNLLYNASTIPSALMAAALNEQDLLCRTFGQCLAGPILDIEVGDMIGKKGPVNPKLFTYVRYNAELTRAGLDRLELPTIDPEKVQLLDSVDGIPELIEVGNKIAASQVRETHFS